MTSANLVTKVKVENFHTQLKSHIDFKFGRQKDLSSLKSDTHINLVTSVNITFSGR